ncbi:cobalt transporter [Bifidobacterium scaligerum]|uniref:Cobalt transporter n=1 Tax=Bifidobacterium scaligerum TaxID=2052656 RepID=A0A2M9HSQ9_9BIFI|nr:cobalt transporter [Bifidobacterium scaligerum]
MGRQHNRYGVHRPVALTAWIMLPVAIFAVIVLLGVMLLPRLLAPKQYVRSADDAYCAAISSDGTRHTLSPEQAGNAALIANIAVNRELPDHAVTVAIATAMQESRLTNLDHGDLDSLGLFQQRPSQGWGTAEQVSDPAYATNIFYDHLMQVPDWQTIPVEDAAQEVQRSGYPDLYANWDSMAHAWASALTGEVNAGITCALEPINGSDANGLITAATAALPNVSITRDTINDDKHSNATTDSTLTVALPAGLSDADQQHVCWQTAGWLVVHAREYGIDSVTANGMSWNRTDGIWTGKESIQDTIIVTLG